MEETKVPMDKNIAPQGSAVCLLLRRNWEILQVIVRESFSRYRRIKIFLKSSQSSQLDRTQAHKTPLLFTGIWVNAGICSDRSLQTASRPEVQKKATSVLLNMHWQEGHEKDKKARGQKNNKWFWFTEVIAFCKQQNKRSWIPCVIPGRSSRWPASHLWNRSSTNSNNTIFLHRPTNKMSQ